MRDRYTRRSKWVADSPRWPSLRLQTLRRDGFACRSCGARGRLEVDHVEPVRTAPEKAFDLSNLQALCTPCHTRKTRIECGHPPPSPARLAWRNAVAEVATNPIEVKRNA